jgi:DNA-binding CsgD family transcriptional regulator
MAEFGESLSERELDVLQCVVNGASNKEVAAELSISQNTVKVHLRNVFTKLGVSSRTEATTAALQQGLVSIPGMELVETTTELPPADKVKEEDGATAVSFPPPLPRPHSPPPHPHRPKTPSPICSAVLTGRRRWRRPAWA